MPGISARLALTVGNDLRGALYAYGTLIRDLFSRGLIGVYLYDSVVLDAWHRRVAPVASGVLRRVRGYQVLGYAITKKVTADT